MLRSAAVSVRVTVDGVAGDSQGDVNGVHGPGSGTGHVGVGNPDAYGAAAAVGRGVERDAAVVPGRQLELGGHQVLAVDVAVGRLARHHRLDEAVGIDETRAERRQHVAVPGVERDDGRVGPGQRLAADLDGQGRDAPARGKVVRLVGPHRRQGPHPGGAGAEEDRLLHPLVALRRGGVTVDVHAVVLAGHVLAAGGEGGLEPEGVDDAALGVAGRNPGLGRGAALEGHRPTGVIAQPGLGEALVDRELAVVAGDRPDHRQHLAVGQGVGVRRCRSRWSPSRVSTPWPM